MTDRETLKAELVELFGQGATVAELLRYARNAVGEDATRKVWVGAVREAFGLSPAGWTLPSSTESFGNGEVRDSVLTWVFLPHLMENREKWDSPPDERLDEARWHDGLRRLTSDQYFTDAEKTHGLSPDGWATLGEEDRRQVVFLEKMRLSLGDDIQLLAALAEQLQRRVNELEGRHETPNHHPAAAGAA